MQIVAEVQTSQPNSQATQLLAERKNLELHYVQVLGSEQVLQPGRQLMGLPLIKATPLCNSVQVSKLVHFAQPFRQFMHVLLT